MSNFRWTSRVWHVLQNYRCPGRRVKATWSDLCPARTSFTQAPSSIFQSFTNRKNRSLTIDKASWAFRKPKGWNPKESVSAHATHRHLSDPPVFSRWSLSLPCFAWKFHVSLSTDDGYELIKRSSLRPHRDIESVRDGWVVCAICIPRWLCSSRRELDQERRSGVILLVLGYRSGESVLSAVHHRYYEYVWPCRVRIFCRFPFSECAFCK